LAKLLRRGAEASVYVGNWFGEEVVFKIRKAKSFRHPTLDSKIRKSRTLREASFIAEARLLGVATPLIYFVDPKEAKIVMQLFLGKRLKEIIDQESVEVVRSWCYEAGRYVARLHIGNIIHGDLTTSNFIVVGGHLSLIDFGLAFYSMRLEDRAVDLHLLKTVVASAHYGSADLIMTAFVKGYAQIIGHEKVEKVLKHMGSVDRRGRYK
jgi:TP53 regulating kinase-like protein